MKLLLLMLILMGCTKTTETEDYLYEQGFYDVNITGFGLLSCPNDFFYRTKFTAKTMDGLEISGTSCQHLFSDEKIISFSEEVR